MTHSIASPSVFGVVSSSVFRITALLPSVFGVVSSSVFRITALLPLVFRVVSSSVFRITALLMVVASGCASGNGITAGSHGAGSAGGEVSAAQAGVEAVPKILLGGNADDTTLDVEQMQPDLVQPRGQGEADAYTAGYEWLDGAFVGGTRTLEYYRGTPLVVNFFSAQCPPCVREMPELQHVFSSLGDEVAFLGLSQDPTPEAAFQLVQKTGVLYDIGWDPDLEVYERTGSVAMPTTAFFTAEGEMAEVFAGVLERQGIRARIDEITGDRDRSQTIWAERR